MTIIGLQWETIWEDKAANHARLDACLAADPPEPGTLIVLPEMWATGFSMAVPSVTETPLYETERFMAELAERYEIDLLGGIVTTGEDGLGRNEAVFYGANGLEARYQKMHPFTPGSESRHYSRGSEIALLEWQGITIVPFICYDLRFPEVFRAARKRRAEVFCVLANWPDTRASHWEILLKARAIENQAYVIGVNRCGDDPAHHYAGGSLIIGPRGEVLAEAGCEEERIEAKLDLEALRQYRQEFPALSDIHPSYAGERRP